MIPFHHTRSENLSPISIAEGRQEGSFNQSCLIIDFIASQAPLLPVSNIAINPNDSLRPLPDIQAEKCAWSISPKRALVGGVNDILAKARNAHQSCPLHIAAKLLLNEAMTPVPRGLIDMQRNLRRMRSAVSEWLTKEGLLGDAEFYSVDAWKEREEEYLTDSLLVLVIDGSTLHTMLNFGGDHGEFDDLVESFGFYYELGNHWNIGFYAIDGYNFSPSHGNYSEKLRDPRWREKASLVKTNAGQKCQDCGSTSPLEAHHCYYAAMREGYEPWEYPLSAFRALCRKCHESRARIEIRMRSYMATLSQTDMERLRESLDHAFSFYEKGAVLSFLENLGPRDSHVEKSMGLLKEGLQKE